nr:MAG TPA: hypothetical protein [Caudoviricetes sp.]
MHPPIRCNIHRLRDLSNIHIDYLSLVSCYCKFQPIPQHNIHIL